MALNIEKLGPNRWFLNVRIRKLGKELRKRETFYGSKTQAEERFIELKWELRDWEDIPKAPLPPIAFPLAPPEIPEAPPRKLVVFRDVLELYRTRREGVGSVDKTRYKALEDRLGNLPLNLIPDELEKFLAELRKPSPKSGRKPLANGTINRYVALARAAFTQAVDAELLDKNPLSKKRFPKLKEYPRDRVLSDFELKKLLRVISEEEPHILSIFQYALSVPCRKSELVNMRRENMDLEASTPSIWIPHGTTKNGRGCYKPIPPDMLDYFRSIPEDCPWVFYRKNSLGYHSLGCFNKAWYKCLRIAGIQGFRFHDSRRLAATAMLNQNTPSQVVQTIANWKTDMLKVYYHQDGQKALGLVRFENKGSGHLVDSFRNEAGENAQFREKSAV
jgi:integrase